MSVLSVSTTQVQRQFSDILHEVLRGNSVVVAKHSKPLAAVVPYAEYEAFREQQKAQKLSALHDRVREMAATYMPVKMDEDEALKQLDKARHATNSD